MIHQSAENQGQKILNAPRITPLDLFICFGFFCFSLFGKKFVPPPLFVTELRR